VIPALYNELHDSPITTNPFQLRSDFPYSSALSTKRRAILPALIAAWMIDTHDWLARTWEAVNSPAAQKLSENGQARLIAQLTAPPCPQDELLHLADTDWKDPVKRTALINRWQEQAIARYKSVLAGLK
jgi:hypothetical protein